MKTLAMLLVAAASFSVAAPAQVTWETSLEAAQVRAKAENKMIFLDLWTGWCGWCLKLQRDTFPSPEAQAALAKVVAVSVKTQDENGKPTRDKALETKFKVDGFPTLLILDAQGREVARQPGYLKPDQFAAWVNTHGKARQQ